MNKSKPILVSLIALIALVAMFGFAVAASLNADILNVEVDGVDVTGVTNGGTMTIAASNDGNIPVEVTFLANEDESDVRVKAWIGGFRSSLESETSRFEMINGSTYNKKLNIKLPADVDPTEDYTLYVRIESRTNSHEESFDLRIQRESYDLRILSVDFDRTANAGDTLAVDIVLKNRGFNRLDDSFVTVRIPELGVSKRAYFGDLTPTDDLDDEDKEDAVLGRMYVNIPSNAQSGTYNVEVSAFNSDSDTRVVETLAIGASSSGSRIITPMKVREVSKNGEVSYDLIIVNSGSRIGVYELSSEPVEGLNVRIDEPVVTVGSSSSKTVKVTVMPTTSGTKTFSVNVYRDGSLIETIPLVAQVSSNSGFSGNNAVILTIVLAIVFVVLLVILIVLLTKKPSKESEEFGESYY
jgi:uncharacterized membrane protein